MIVPPNVSVLICNYLYKIANPKTWDSCWKGSDSSQSVRNYINHPLLGITFPRSFEDECLGPAPHNKKYIFSDNVLPLLGVTLQI